jgi:UDP-3-O-[3-hydroxymyristoyl] N-acetylglucosamine deacetylase
MMIKIVGTPSAQAAKSPVSAHSDIVAFASGVGLHSGQRSTVQIKSSSEATKLQTPIFEARIGSQRASAPALVSRLSGTARATALVLRGEKRFRFELQTVEHYLAALFVMGLPPLHAVIESCAESDDKPVEALEMPILDGSAQKWLEILNVFPIYRPQSRKAWKVIRSFEVKDEEKFVCMSPLSGDEAKLDIFCEVDFGFKWQQNSQYSLSWSDLDASLEDFKRRIAPARTFGFAHELEMLRKRGLALGGSMDNAILLDGDKVINPNGFLVENELAAHKLLDIVGDFALLGKPLIGRIDTFKSGHSMHVRAAQEAIKTGALVEVDLDSSGKIY